MAVRPLFQFPPSAPPSTSNSSFDADRLSRLMAQPAAPERLGAGPTGAGPTGAGPTGAGPTAVRRAKAAGWRAFGAVALAGLAGLASAPLTGPRALAGCNCSANGAGYAAAPRPAADPYFAPPAAAYAAPVAPYHAAPYYGEPAQGAPYYGAAARPGPVPYQAAPHHGYYGAATNWNAPATGGTNADHATDGGFEPVPRRSDRLAAGPTWWQEDSGRGPLTAPRPGDPAPVPPLPTGRDGGAADEERPDDGFGPLDPPDEPLPPVPEVTADPLDPPGDAGDAGDETDSPGDRGRASDPSFGDPSFGDPSTGPQAPPAGGDVMELDPDPVRAPRPVPLDDDTESESNRDGRSNGGRSGDDEPPAWSSRRDRGPLMPPSLPGLPDLGDTLPNPFGDPYEALMPEEDRAPTADPFAPTGPDVTDVPPREERSVRPAPGPLPGPANGADLRLGPDPQPAFTAPAPAAGPGYGGGSAHGGVAGYAANPWANSSYAPTGFVPGGPGCGPVGFYSTPACGWGGAAPFAPHAAGWGEPLAYEQPCGCGAGGCGAGNCGAGGCGGFGGLYPDHSGIVAGGAGFGLGGRPGFGGCLGRRGGGCSGGGHGAGFGYAGRYGAGYEPHGAGFGPHGGLAGGYGLGYAAGAGDGCGAFGPF